MNYYRKNSYFFLSKLRYDDMEPIDESEIKNYDGIIYLLKQSDPMTSRRGFKLMSVNQIESKNEDISIIENQKEVEGYPEWIYDKISKGLVKVINTDYPEWEAELTTLPIRWNVNIFALGDVGSTLAIGLRLLGKNINLIGIYDRNQNRLKRWEHELGQIRKPFDERAFAPIKVIEKEELFNCDMFIFCASSGIPPVGSGVSDVRMAQFEKNRQIISEYAKIARNMNFKGYFSVVSDPIDPLCKSVFLESNKNEEGKFDFQGLASNKIIGFGLGVMNARAAFYSEQSPELSHYIDEGTVFGPHGNGLIVADSINNYNHEKSLILTENTVNANLKIREFGFKPYIAPSLSSGSLSIISAIEGDYFYGSSLMGEAYMGSKVRLTDSGLEVTQYNLHPLLKQRLENTYNDLRSII
ncbi:MAG: lactate dehydrogenase [Gudongella sp.]|jgi:hypothetical protein|nr:lactate dehydrogenase [Gudongella sp.]